MNLYLTSKDKPQLAAVALTIGVFATFFNRTLDQEGLASLLIFALFPLLLGAAALLVVVHNLAFFVPSLRAVSRFAALATCAVAAVMLVINADELLAQRREPELVAQEATRVLCSSPGGPVEEMPLSKEFCFAWAVPAAGQPINIPVLPKRGGYKPAIGARVTLETKWFPSVLWGARSYLQRRNILAQH